MSLNLQYSKVFSIPRKMFKHFLSFWYPIVIKWYPLPKVKSIPETIDKIVEDNCSICRFGDGELLYMAEKRSLPFQKQDERLRNYFIEILKSEQDKILVGLPVGYFSLKNLKPKSQLLWRAIIVWTYPRIKPYLLSGKIYYNASMTRPYMDYADRSHSEKWFTSLMRIWENRDIVLIEGCKSRLGVGNNLFEKAKSVKRILGPAHDAFDQFDSLLNFAKTMPKDSLIMVAMGPTAKPICYELAKMGYQAVDIGNLDVEYEWYLQGATEKVKLKGKYTSEAKGGRIVEDIQDEKYEQQIIATFLNE